MSNWPAYVWIIESFDPDTGLREIEQRCGMYRKPARAEALARTLAKWHSEKGVVVKTGWQFEAVRYARSPVG